MSLSNYAKVSFVDGLHFTGKNKNGFKIDMGTNQIGEPTGLSPTELVLQAAGGCSSMDVVFILRKRKIEPEQFELELDGVKRKEHPQVYESINLTYRAKGPGLTIPEMNRAVALSIDKYCSVFGMLKLTAKITWKCELID